MAAGNSGAGNGTRTLRVRDTILKLVEADALTYKALVAAN
jgi:hypothetical protein